MPTAKQIRLINPERKKKRAPRPKRGKNPGHLIALGLLPATNPNRRSNNVSKKKAPKKKNKRAGNPVVALKSGAKHHKPPKRKRNPEKRSLLKQPLGMIKLGLVALLGMLATRQVPELILRDKNKGVWGYLANFATAFAGAIGAGAAAGREVGAAAGIGGTLYVIQRILTEQFSPIGKVLALSGLGDATASGSLGRYKDEYFPVPIIRDKNGQPIIPKEIDAAAVAMALAQQQQRTGQVASIRQALSGGMNGVSRMQARSAMAA